jgi:hypothetical protein
MSNGGNPYGVLGPVPGLSFAGVFSTLNAPTIAYLPFWPLVTGAMYAIYHQLGFSDRFVYYFLLKQPIIIGDVILAYLLYSYVSARVRSGSSMWVMMFWLLSPYTVVVSGIWGMFDSIAMAFIMISVMSTNSLKRAFWTGLGIFAKSIPLIYALPTTIRRPGKPWSLILSIALPVLLSLGTFTALGWPIPTITATLASTASKGGESMSMWDLFFYLVYLRVIQPLTPNVYQVLGLVWIPALLLFTLLAIRRFEVETDYGLVQTLLVVTLAFLIFKARVTEQYAIYLLALSAIDVAIWNRGRKRILLVTMGVVLGYLLINNYFLVRFLAPVYPDFSQVESALFQMIGPVRYAVNFLLGSIFTALNVVYLIELFKKRNPHTMQPAAL